MGQKFSSQEFLKSDRIIDNENDGIYVGVISPKPENELSGQAIRFGDSRLYRLEFFEKSDSNLTYKFESGSELKFYKRPNSEIIVSYSNPDQDLNVTKTWAHKDFWKNPSWGSLSTELDEIGKFIKEK
jgi:hypothetical protein